MYMQVVVLCVLISIPVCCRDDCPELRSRIGHSMLFHPVSTRELDVQ